MYSLTEEQFKYIYSQYGRAIRDYIYYRSGDTNISDDITQETFIKVWEKQFVYDEKKRNLFSTKLQTDCSLIILEKSKLEVNIFKS